MAGIGPGPIGRRFLCDTCSNLGRVKKKSCGENVCLSLDLYWLCFQHSSHARLLYCAYIGEKGRIKEGGTDCLQC